MKNYKFNWGIIPKNKEDLSILVIGNSFSYQVFGFWNSDIFVPGGMIENSTHKGIYQDYIAVGDQTYDRWLSDIENKTTNYYNLKDKLNERHWDIICMLNTSANWDPQHNYPLIEMFAQWIRDNNSNKDVAFFIYASPSRPGACPKNIYCDSTKEFELINEWFRTLSTTYNIPESRIIPGSTAMQYLRKTYPQPDDKELTIDYLHPQFGLPILATGITSFMTIIGQVFDNIDFDCISKNIVSNYKDNDECNLSKSTPKDLLLESTFFINIDDSNRAYAISAAKYALANKFK